MTYGAHTTIISFSGPSGSGKTKLVDALLTAYPDHCCRWRQATTRPRRSLAESYLFLNEAQYDAIAFQLTCRTTFGGAHYGTFVEAGTEGAVVLTVVDAAGVADLTQDVLAHNKSLETSGEPGKFGASPVNLVTVLMTYALTEESITRRGRAERGLDFIQGEVERLRTILVNPDIIMETSGDWPDPVEFFETHIWPLIRGDATEVRKQEILEMLGVLTSFVYAGPSLKYLDSLAELLSPIMEGLYPVPEAPTTPALQSSDEIDALLAEKLSEAVEVQREEMAAGIPEPPVAEGIPAEPELPPTESALIEEVAAPPTEETAAETETVVPVEPGPEPAIPAEEPTLPPSVSTAPPRSSSTKTIAEAIEGRDFEHWILTAGLGGKTFEDLESFEAVFTKYLSEGGIVIQDLRYTYREARDARNSVVKVFEAKTEKELFTLSFNTRLRRLTHHALTPA
jgi:hypothetical protein